MLHQNNTSLSRDDQFQQSQQANCRCAPLRLSLLLVPADCDEPCRRGTGLPGCSRGRLHVWRLGRACLCNIVPVMLLCSTLYRCLDPEAAVVRRYRKYSVVEPCAMGRCKSAPHQRDVFRLQG